MSNLPAEDETLKWQQNVQHFDDINNENQFQSHHPEIYSYAGNIPNSGRYPPPPITESYSVLPVGHGNFLKVYRTNENEQQPKFSSYKLFSSDSLIPPQNNNRKETNNENSTSTIINQLVTNWTPNVSGNYSPFGEQQQQQIQEQPEQQLQQQSYEQKIFSQQQQQHHDNLHNIAQQQTISSSSQQKTPGSKSFNVTGSGSPEITKEQTGGNSNNTLPATTQHKNNIKGSKTNGSLENHQILHTPDIKKRIVAEVKPMRMSYSDVLSKNVDANTIIPNGVNNFHLTSTEVLMNTKSTKNSSIEKTKNINSFPSNDRSKSQFDEKDKPDISNKNKKMDNLIYKNDENSSSNGINNKEKKNKITDEIKDTTTANGNLNKKSSKKLINEKNKPKQAGGINPAETIKKRSNKRENDDDSKLKTGNDKEFYYNVAKTEITFEKAPKCSQNSGTKKFRQSLGQKNNNNTSNGCSTNRYERQNYSKTRGQRQRRDQTYELISKCVDKWLEYTMKILTWLFNLIYDVIVLSFGIGLERLKILYSNGGMFITNLRKDFKNNSGKPNAWIKNLFKKFDNKFKKTSKWAFWRNFNKKKYNDEHFTDFYKNGRLPQTGDEAMYSLLNCKEKDAYSILGVSMDSTQEQIRKHYKKIAVLVHPDKNKQPGAEEAFKVLQRAFELIGEPENRKSYDKSLAEALNAEKAWSELHDLLSQLQSKIAEAANTIRCSSCGLRHPRKLTDRPHYAARECGSCKIRHSAREGDIWAETSVFGLRWKYLALMEGKCYDITEWANCQKGALSHLQPNSHIVQYRIVRGGQQQQQQQQQQQHQQNIHLEKEKLKRDQNSEPSLDEFLDNLYSGQNQQQNASSRRRSKRN